MFLLNRYFTKGLSILTFLFTFHYVSIKSLTSAIKGDALGNLHSTMFLLNPQPYASRGGSSAFTFHYVSIKSKSPKPSSLSLYVYLHSTMFLLNRNSRKAPIPVAKEFTFHYVSIKSSYASSTFSTT